MEIDSDEGCGTATGGEELQMSEPLVNLSGPGSVLILWAQSVLVTPDLVWAEAAPRKVVITARSREVMVIIL